MIEKLESGTWHKIQRFLGRPVDGASLALFRISFGAVIVWHAIKNLTPSNGRTTVYKYFIEPTWNVPFHGFEWVVPLPAWLMYGVFVVILLTGVCLTVGLWSRVSAAVFCVLFSYTFLLDATRYLNHYYLMCLLAFLLIWMPTSSCFSVDNWLRRRKLSNPDPQRHLIPFWSVFLLRGQMFILYFYAGLAKLNPEWIAGRPVWSTATKFQNSMTQFFGEEKAEAFRVLVDYQMLAQSIAIGGLIFDLAIPFLLMIRRTRILAIVLVAGFHGFNNQAFHIGVFPVLAFAATLIFFDVSWPRRVWAWVRRPRFSRPHLGWLLGGLFAIPGIGLTLGWRFKPSAPVEGRPSFQLSRLAILFVFIWTTFHITFPLRHYVIPGNAQWTEEGHYFAWRMMLRSKTAQTKFKVYDPHLFVTDASGNMDVNWDHWTKQYPKRLHLNLDACDFQWRQLPAILVIYEPLIGERIILNPQSAEVHDAPALKSTVEAEWQRQYGRKLRWKQTTSLDEVISHLERSISRRIVRSPDSKLEKLIVEALDDLKTLCETPPLTSMEREQRAVSLNDILGFLLRQKEYGPIVQDCLSELRPFALQGRSNTGAELLVVDDVSLFNTDQHHRTQIDRAKWQGSHEVYLDADRLRGFGWASLPRALLLFSDGRPDVIWNCHNELRPFQLFKLEGRGYMIHQYAQRIASEWQKGFGCRPQVYVNSMVKLNSRPFVPYIDPQVNLAGVPFNAFASNDWIMPFPTDVDPATRPIEKTTSDGKEMVVSRFPNGSNLTEVVTNWQGENRLSTTKVWYENGQLAMTASYRNDLNHGFAEHHYDNGQIATRVNYVDGTRHGLATMWYRDGTLSWKGTFVDGKLEGVAQGWQGDGRLVEAASFIDGRRTSAESKTSDVIPVNYEDQFVPAGGGQFDR